MESDAGAGDGGVSRWVWAGVMSLMFVCVCMLFVCVYFVLSFFLINKCVATI